MKKKQPKILTNKSIANVYLLLNPLGLGCLYTLRTLSLSKMLCIVLISFFRMFFKGLNHISQIKTIRCEDNFPLCNARTPAIMCWAWLPLVFLKTGCFETISPLLSPSVWNQELIVKKMLWLWMVNHCCQYFLHTKIKLIWSLFIFCTGILKLLQQTVTHNSGTMHFYCNAPLYLFSYTEHLFSTVLSRNLMHWPCSWGRPVLKRHSS